MTCFHCLEYKIESASFLNLNNPTRPLSTEDPTFDMYLPVDDTSWNECVRLSLYIIVRLLISLQTAKPGDAVKISTGFSLKIGGFARLAQATYLLSQAFHSVTPSTVIEDATNDIDQTAQLRRTLLALVHAADSEATHRRLDFCASSELSFRSVIRGNTYRDVKPNSYEVPSSCFSSTTSNVSALLPCQMYCQISRSTISGLNQLRPSIG